MPTKRFFKSHVQKSRILLFLSYTFGIETTNTFMHFLENHTRIQTKRSKVYTRFQTIHRAKTIPFGAAHTYKPNVREYPPPPPPQRDKDPADCSQRGQNGMASSCKLLNKFRSVQSQNHFRFYEI